MNAFAMLMPPVFTGYVPLFGAPPYDIKNERDDDIPFEEQLRGIENVMKQGKVSAGPPHACKCLFLAFFLSRHVPEAR